MKTSAPGKLFLAGEYAVLKGGPALLSPVRQRARVSITPNVSSKVITYTTTPKEYSLKEALRTLPLLKATVSELGHLKQLEGALISLDTSDFYRDGVKVGLGSSAALIVALIKSLEPGIDKQEHLRKAIQCHSAFQRGIGSGADIALATENSPIVFRLGQPPTPIMLPNNLHLLAIWSGEPASTTKYVTTVAKWGENNPESYQEKINELCRTAAELIECLKKGNSESFLAKVEEYDRGLEHLSSISGANFYNETHMNMRKKVELANCKYKPSGAGGGDFGIAYSTEKKELLTLAEQLSRENRYTFAL